MRSILLESSQERRKSGSPTDCDDTQRSHPGLHPALVSVRGRDGFRRRSALADARGRHSSILIQAPRCGSGKDYQSRTKLGKAASRLWRTFRIKKVGKARMVCHIFEIQMVPCLKAVGTVQLDGIVEVTKAILRAVGQAVQQSQAVVREVHFGVLLENLFHVISRLVELSTIDEGDGVIIVFPQSFERRSPSRELLVTGIEMDAGTVGKLPAGTGEHLLQQTLRLIKLVLLHRLQP